MKTGRSSCRRLDDASLTSPSDLHGLSLLDDHRHGTHAAGPLQHTLAGVGVPLHVVLHEFDPAPLQILARFRAVGTGSGRVELNRLAQGLFSRGLTRQWTIYTLIDRSAVGHPVDNTGCPRARVD